MFEMAVIGASNLLGFLAAGLAIKSPLKEAAATSKALTAAIDRLAKEIDDLEITIRNVQAATSDIRQKARERHGHV